MSKKIVKYNKNIQNTAEEMNNTMILLFGLKLLYYYKEVRPQFSNGKQIITWDNHIPDRANCGPFFTTLKQYEHILKSGAFHCILFDGSIIRSAFIFDSNNLINHSHLWWPAPYNNESYIEEVTPQSKYEDFINDSNWKKRLRMRSPIRIDFDPKNMNDNHPLVHMHIQHQETRIHIDKPICFNKFVKYIFQNFYSSIDLDFRKWNLLDFSYEKSEIYGHISSRIII
jgi:hypothetical protein